VKQKARFTLLLNGLISLEIFCFLKGNRIQNTLPGRDGQADRGILVIENTSEVIQAENLLKQHGGEIRVMARSRRPLISFRLRISADTSWFGRRT